VTGSASPCPTAVWAKRNQDSSYVEITNLAPGVVSVYFVYEDDGPLGENIAIDPETGIDFVYGGVVVSIKSR